MDAEWIIPTGDGHRQTADRESQQNDERKLPF
jgi:hypothetical protein